VQRVTIDPENIRIQEREFDAQAAERVAHEILAGSSAATAGGGSGFTSPAYADITKGGSSSKAAPASIEARLTTGPSITTAGAERVQEIRPGSKRIRSGGDDMTPRPRKSPKLSRTSGSDDDDDDDDSET